jgi:hypothetical protein
MSHAPDQWNRALGAWDKEIGWLPSTHCEDPKRIHFYIDHQSPGRRRIARVRSVIKQHEAPQQALPHVSFLQRVAEARNRCQRCERPVKFLYLFVSNLVTDINGWELECYPQVLSEPLLELSSGGVKLSVLDIYLPRCSGFGGPISGL